MYIIINLLVFVFTLFLYIHIFYHIKTSNYLEIYEIDNISKDKFEELCNYKQPILLNDYSMLNNINIDSIHEKYGNFDIKILKENTENIYLPIKFKNAYELFNIDNSFIYISDNNMDFLEETTLNKEFSKEDGFLRPFNISNIYYNIILGSKNHYSKLKYNLNSRNYFYVLDGNVEIMLCCPNNYKYLHLEKDYENFEFFSNIDLNNVKDNYKNDFDKVKFLKVNLTKGKLLQIPPYWFYSIKILDDKTLIANLNYRTYMNVLAISPQIFIHFLQNNNIKINSTKILDV
jgi:hypothetical protein